MRRLYNPKGKKLPLPMVVELNRRLVKGYQKYQHDSRIVKLKRSVIAYNKQLMQLNIRDHQVEIAKFSAIKVVFTLLYRVAKVLILSAGVLPGLILFAPVFIAGKIISVKKSKEALAASTVKIQAKDVVATWKLLVALVLAPALYTFYTLLLFAWAYYNRVQGYIPQYVPLPLVFIFGFIFFPSITFAALRFGEVGMDIFKSLRPLVLSINPSSGNTLVKLRERRAALVAEVTDLINTLGPEMFPDFESFRIISAPAQDGTEPRTPTRTTRTDSEAALSDAMPSLPKRSYTDGSLGMARSAQGNLPRNDSFKDLSSVGLFATRPGTPNRSRSRTNSEGGGFPVQGLSTLDSKDGFDEVSKKIRGAMKERGHRRRASERSSWDEDGGSRTPGSESNKKDV